MPTTSTIRTARLSLVPATPELARAELRDTGEFSALLGAAVPGDWPPEELSDARPIFLGLLEANPTWIGWLGWYAIELGDEGADDRGDDREDDARDDASASSSRRRATLVGSVGFKGPPDAEGAVEIGCSVLPSFQKRGLATEMTDAVARWAAPQGARRLLAHVRPENVAAVRVLAKLGFHDTGTCDASGAALFARDVLLEGARPDAEGMDSALEAIHRDVDEQAHLLEAVHRDRLHCRPGCCFCCVDEITVFEVEARRIRRRHAQLLAAGAPHPVGACAFLDEDGSCRVYEDRPYVCRTQGLPLRWEDEGPGDEPVELRDICPLNETDRPVEDLSQGDCWEIGPFEERLAAMQAKCDGGSGARIRLRDLFGR